MILGLILCFVPLIAALLIFTFGFKLKFSHQLFACLLGLIAVLPISFLQFFIPDLPLFESSPVLRTLLKSIFLYGCIEEIIKMIGCIPLPRKNHSQLEFLFLSFVMGISLGCFESAVYFFDHLQIANNRGAQLLYGQIAVRIFTSDIIHMMCTGICSMFIWSCHKKQTKISFLLIAILLHGIYDFFAGFSNGLRWFSIIVVLMSIAECRIKYSSLKNNEE